MVLEFRHLLSCFVFLCILLTQVPGIMNQASFLDPCTNGVGYSLLMIVPTFYFISSILFTALGVVMSCWDRRTSLAEFPYDKMKTEKCETLT